MEKDYKGLISIDLEIPLDKDGAKPDFDNPKIVFNSYRKNVRKINFEDLGKHSQNLLDIEPISYESLYGDEALEEGYLYPTIRTFMFKGTDGKFYSQLQRNKDYEIIPLVSLPSFDLDKNGIDPGIYEGYAYKWEVIKHNNLTSDSGQEIIETTDWKYIQYNPDDVETEDILNYYEVLNSSENNWKQTDPWDKLITSKELNDIEYLLNNNITQIAVMKKERNNPLVRKISLKAYYRGELVEEFTNASDYYTTLGFDIWSFKNDHDPNSEFHINNMKHLDVEDHDIINDSDINSVEELKDLVNKIIHRNEDGEYYEVYRMGVHKSTIRPFATLSEPFRVSDLNYQNTYIEFQVSYLPDFSDFNYVSLNPISENVNKAIPSIKTTDRIMRNSSNGVQVRLFITPAKRPSNTYIWTTNDLTQMEIDAEVLTSTYMPYSSEGVILPSLENTSSIGETRFMTFFEDMLVLYGGEKFGNIVYLSDFQNIGYFPFKYALNQIPDEIIHIHPFRGIMLAFTKSDIWAIEKAETETESGSIITDFYAKKVLQNIFIDVHLKNTIRTVGKYVMVMLEDKIIFLKPNSFTGDSTDLSYVEVSAPIGNIIKDPNDFIKNRLKFYNIFVKEDLKFDLATEVDNRDFKIILSTFVDMKDIKTPYMLELIFDGTRGIWTIHDTLSTAYPVFFSKGLKYFKSHPENFGGVVLSDNTGVNKYNMLDAKKAHVDVHNFNYETHTIVTRPDGYLAQPINLLIDLGYMNISNHLTKRFHEARMEVTNINTSQIKMAYSFRIDNKQQQSTYEIFMQVIDGTIEEREYISFENLGESSINQFENFRLDLAKFTVTDRLQVRIPVNGRGRVPRLVISFETTNDFEIFKFLIVFKEQTGRMVSQR